MRRRRIPARLVITMIAVVLLGGAWLWLRDSSLVAVKRVSVSGVSGPDSSQIQAALQRAARDMTTLDVQTDQLRTAVAPYPVVKGIEVSTGFPHTLRVHVVEQIPVGTVVVAGRSIPVAADGTLLRDMPAAGGLPTVPVSVPPGGSKLTDAGARAAVAVLAAAPYSLLARIQDAQTVSEHGVTVSLRSGPTIYFGDPSELRDKWLAAVAVLGDHGSVGATYLDVTDPGRPVAGAGSDTSKKS